MDNKKKQFLSPPAELLAIHDTMLSLRILIPLVAALQVALLYIWFNNVTGDRSARGSLIYLGGYIYMLLASLAIGFLLQKYSKDLEKNRKDIFHTQMTYAWMLPIWTATLTMLDAVNTSDNFSTQFYVMANVLILGICYMDPGKWTLIQLVTGFAVLLSTVLMSGINHFVYISELIAYVIISIIAGRFVFKMKINNYERQAELTEVLNSVEYDSLTGVYSREAFYRKIEELLKNDPDTPYTLVASDIDNFKQINSVFGNDMGNAVLCYLADEFRKYGSITARYGADQFISIISASQKVSLEEFNNIAGEIARKAPVGNLSVKYGYYDIAGVNDEKLSVSVSVMCDRALLAAKSIKHNYSCIVASYDGPLSQQQIRARKCAMDFQEAIEKKEFVMWYQPKIDPYSGKVVAAEALVRWKKPSGKIMFPGDFMDIYEENGQITVLDEYIFDAVCTQQKKWLDQGKKIVPISINLSRKSMTRSDLILSYTDILKKTGIPIGKVPIEITESAAIRSVLLSPIVKTMTDNGFRIHMDDFGSGQSSINGLNIFHIDVVKIDKSLVDTIGTISGNIIVSGLMGIIKKLGFRIVAEGVEEKDQLQFLMDNHVDEIQGYYYSKPLPVEDFEIFMKKNMNETVTV